MIQRRNHSIPQVSAVTIPGPSSPRGCGDATLNLGNAGERFVSTAPQPGYSIAQTSRIRADFPALGREHRGYSVAYFDGPGGTQVPSVVPEAMSDYLIHHN